MTAQRLYLGLCAVVFIGIGIVLLGWPELVLAKVDIFFETPTAFADIRADYGGCTLGIGLFLTWCCLDTQRSLAGLWCVALCMGGYVLGRSLSIAIDGTPKPIIYTLLLVEFSASAGAFVLLWVGRNPSAPQQK